MSVEAAEMPDVRDAEPPLADRRRPLGILVVIVLSLGRVIIEVVGLVVLQPSGFLAWIAGGSNIPSFDQGTPVWWIGSAASVVLIATTAASIVGLWRSRTWGWSMALTLAGLILLLDIGWWMAGQPRYPGMFLNMVAVFYLNQRDVRSIYLPSSL
jgi:hypothetical protein